YEKVTAAFKAVAGPEARASAAKEVVPSSPRLPSTLPAVQSPTGLVQPSVVREVVICALTCLHSEAMASAAKANASENPINRTIKRFKHFILPPSTSLVVDSVTRINFIPL